MIRRSIGPKLVVASHNAGKVREISQLIASKKIFAVSAAELNLPEPEETEPTFFGNALIKAHAAAKGSRLPALADDSGLCVDALNGAPGVYSARWAGTSKDFKLAMSEVHLRMQASGSKTAAAHFACVLALAWPDGDSLTFEGKIEGRIVWPARGEFGFGYDPIFVPLGFDQTFGEMDPAKKHAMSHRARAFAKFVETCLD
ncbi:MAG: RdgB/HAM1 family non-canonical purine NTP pyrophosphatase [Micropepsaceae bacterium]